MIGFVDTFDTLSVTMGLIKKFTTASPHLKIALVVAPLLAVGGYIIADFYRPAAEPVDRQGGGSLQVSENCRLLGDLCKLLHREIAANLSATVRENGQTLVYLGTSVPLEGAVIASDDREPVVMETRGSARRWKATLPYAVHEGDRIRLAMVSGDRRYFAEITARR